MEQAAFIFFQISSIIFPQTPTVWDTPDNPQLAKIRAQQMCTKSVHNKWTKSQIQKIQVWTMGLQVLQFDQHLAREWDAQFYFLENPNLS